MSRGLRRYWTLARRRVGLSSLTVHADGLTFHGAAIHRPHLHAIEDGRDEPLTRERFMSSIAPGDLVIDVGAYLGTFTLRAAQRVGPQGRVIAFEPDRVTHDALVRSIEANGLSGTVDLRQQAVSDSAGPVTLHRHPTDPSMNSILPGSPGEIVSVGSLRLDQLEGPLPAVVKVDAEGADLAVLQGLGVRMGSVRAVFVELSTTQPEQADAIVELLEGAGFSSFEVINERAGDAHPYPLTAQDWEATHVNLCATRTG